MQVPRRAFIVSATLLLAAGQVASAQNANTFDFITHNEIHIAASPAAVWPHLRNVNAWKLGARTSPAGGTKDAIGERFAAAPEGASSVSYYIETVELAPAARWTIRLNAPDGGLMGYATWTLSAVDGGTLLRYDTFLRSTAPGADLTAEAVSEAGRRTNREAAQRMDTEFSRLKQLVEASAGGK